MGFDKVGNNGNGESIWLGFFLYDILTRFTTIAQLCNDEIFAATCRDEALRFRNNHDLYAWNWEWYKRAWFGNGIELGTSSNEECRMGIPLHKAGLFYQGREILEKYPWLWHPITGKIQS